MNKQEIQYSYIGETQSHVCTINQSSVHKDVDASYNWVNVEYPTPHTHRHWELFVIVSGQIVQKLNGEARLMKTGDACLIQPSDRHCFLYPDREKNPSYQHFNIVLSEEYVQSVLKGYFQDEPFSLNDENRYFTVDEHIINTVLEKSVIAQAFDRGRYELAAKFLFNLLFASFMEQRLFPRSAPSWLGQVLIYLNNPDNFQGEARFFAEGTGYSYSQLSRLFKETVKKSISEYHAEVKMIYAEKMLTQTEKSVLDIALDLGYESVSAFHRKFKAGHGLTPLEYRKGGK